MTNLEINEVQTSKNPSQSRTPSIVAFCNYKQRHLLLNTSSKTSLSLQLGAIQVQKETHINNTLQTTRSSCNNPITKIVVYNYFLYQKTCFKPYDPFLLRIYNILLQFCMRYVGITLRLYRILIIVTYIYAHHTLDHTQLDDEV